MNSLHIVTFYTKEYTNWALDLRESFKNFQFKNYITKFHLFTPSKLSHLFSTHSHFLKFKKGYGNMFWKGSVIKNVANQAKEGDVIIYLDADITLKSPQKLLDLLNNNEKCVFFNIGECIEKNYIEQYWTKKEVFDFYNIPPLNNYQVMSGIQIYFINNNDDSLLLINQYASDSLTDLITEEYDPSIQHPNFKIHRHDQSILSVLLHFKFTQFTILSDPTQFGENQVDPIFELKGLHGQTLPLPNPKITIITPMTSTKYLDSIIKSVNNQTFNNTELIIVVDHPDNFQSIQSSLSIILLKKEIHLIHLPFNTGSNNWNGHRIYAAIPHLLPETDYFIFLDEDNELEPYHVSSLLNTINQGNVWAFSLRKIIDKNGNYICNDDCESLGHLDQPWDKSPNLIDTGCYFLPREIAIQLSYSWNIPARPPNGQLEVDRLIFKMLSEQITPFNCSKEYTLKYRVGNRKDSVQKEYFQKGNDEMNKKKYLQDSSQIIIKKKISDLPNLYLYHFKPDVTNLFINSSFSESVAYLNWEPNTISELKNRFNLINGYTTIPPSGSIVVVQMCLPEYFPLGILKRRDLIRIGYTVEGPNIRHQQQWDFKFLDEHFDYILTYFEPLLNSKELKSTRIFCPYLCRINLNFKVDRDLLITNKVYDKSIGMVLENRNLSGVYDISNNKLQCLDKLRSLYATILPRVTVFGENWEELAKENKVKLGNNSGKTNDKNKSIDYLKNFTFALIIENCNGNGYVSEKIYDAFVAGCIPIYYGNISEKMREIIPDDMYIDAKKYNPERLKKIISEIGIKEIIRLKENIHKNRETVFRKADATVYANIISNIFNENLK